MSGQFDDATRDLVRKRAGGRCELCGMSLPVGHFHHRRPRAMGGTKRIEASGAANCLFLHSRCHADIESSRERALANGWLVRQSDIPASVPAKLWRGLTLLSDDGTFSSA